MSDREQGSDVSGWQLDIDYEKFAGYAKFVFVRAGFGGYSSAAYCKDHRFDVNMAGFLKTKILTGTYWFGNYMTSPERQAEWYAECVNGQWGQLPPMLDLEWYWQPYPKPLNMLLWMQRFMKRTDELSNMETLFYCNPSMLRYLKPIGKDYPDWMKRRKLSVAHYTLADEPSLYGFPEWTFWQHTDKGPGLLWGVTSKGLDLQWGKTAYLDRYRQPSVIQEPEPVVLTLEERVAKLEHSVSVLQDKMMGRG